MPIERIDRYKKTALLGFCDDDTEEKYQKLQSHRGRSTSIYALSSLFVLNLVFAFLEHWILGLNSMIPLIAYLVVAFISGAGALYSLSSHSTSFLLLRSLVPGLLTLIVLLLAVFLQQYRLYHAIEIALLVIWIGSLNVLSLRLSALISVIALALFTATAFFSGVTGLKMTGLLTTQVASLTLALYLSFMLERHRRMLFLTNQVMQDVYDRQESWAYTLIDLDMALSGIKDLPELIARLMEFIKPVINYDSHVFTSLEGKGPKPVPDDIDGTLFQQEDQTIWSDDLMTRLSQTRQALTSSQYEMVKGFLGREKQNFLHFRMDIPVMSESSLVGVISLRRKSEPYDDLDMTASVSLATQAMMIFKRTQKSSQMSETLMRKVAETSKKPPVVKKVETPPPDPDPSIIQANEAQAEIPKESTDYSDDLDVTQDPTVYGEDGEPVTETQSSRTDADVTVVPHEVMEKIKKDTASAKKTITLLSRENADQIAVDRYRTAAVEGEPLSILLIEVDGLSAIRERDGDQTAYKVFAGIVKTVFSKTDKEHDVLGRYGQNGLSVLLPRVDMNAAEKFAESLRQHTEQATFKTPYGERSATLSIGVAAITDETGNYESMVKRADMALFVAKKNGRNCVKVRL
ncbi:MAG: GGDEF domain-containing protein [Gammaproteobacteria bacterium]|nr:GGDEF domain-containing protein [Gammaproteobacteria bacterium]